MKKSPQDLRAYHLRALAFAGSEAERLQGPLLAAILRLLALAGSLRQFSRSVHRMANLVHGLTQAADGMKSNVHGRVLCFLRMANSMPIFVQD